MGIQQGSSTYERVWVNGKTRQAQNVIVEQAMGKPLPAGAVVHHADGDRKNNEKTNLVVCPSQAYHNLIHARMRALAACGDASKRKCKFCKRYDFVENLYYQAINRNYSHTECGIAYDKARRPAHAHVNQTVEEIAAYNKTWREQNKDKLAKYAETRRLKNKGAI